MSCEDILGPPPCCFSRRLGPRGRRGEGHRGRAGGRPPTGRRPVRRGRTRSSPGPSLEEGARGSPKLPRGRLPRCPPPAWGSGARTEGPRAGRRGPPRGPRSRSGPGRAAAGGGGGGEAEASPASGRRFGRRRRPERGTGPVSRPAGDSPRRGRRVCLARRPAGSLLPAGFGPSRRAARGSRPTAPGLPLRPRGGGKPRSRRGLPRKAAAGTTEHLPSGRRGARRVERG